MAACYMHLKTDCPFASLMQTDCSFASWLHATPQNGLSVCFIDADGLFVCFMAACYTSKRTVRLIPLYFQLPPSQSKSRMEGLEANACIAAVSTSYVAVPPEAAPSTSSSANTPAQRSPSQLSPLVPSIDISSDTRVLTHLNKLYCYFGPI
jgi:hypothetical protein